MKNKKILKATVSPIPDTLYAIVCDPNPVINTVMTVYHKTSDIQELRNMPCLSELESFDATVVAIIEPITNYFCDDVTTGDGSICQIKLLE